MSSLPTSFQLYEVFFSQVKNLVEVQQISIPDTISLLVSLTKLALNISPHRLDYIDQILDFSNTRVKLNINSPELHSQPTQLALLDLLLSLRGIRGLNNSRCLAGRAAGAAGSTARLVTRGFQHLRYVTLHSNELLVGAFLDDSSILHEGDITGLLQDADGVGSKNAGFGGQ